jgi:ankyrin repeat protein
MSGFPFVEREKNDTLLHWAGEYGSKVKLLIERGVNIHQKTSAGLTPLFWAAVKDRAETARLKAAA